MDQQRFESLKRKYDPALKAIQQQGVQVAHLHEDQGKLVIVGKAPSEAAKNKVWDTIKQVDSAYQDLAADISVDPSMAPATGANAPDNHHGGEHIYTVEAGDTLSKISKQFYGEASLFLSIFEANRNILTDPNKIQPGMQLRIPASGKQVVS
jgi:nucleoid-associated protein YgaU